MKRLLLAAALLAMFATLAVSEYRNPSTADSCHLHADSVWVRGDDAGEFGCVLGGAE